MTTTMEAPWKVTNCVPGNIHIEYMCVCVCVCVIQHSYQQSRFTITRHQGITVGTHTRLQARTIWDLNLGWGKRFSSSAKHPDQIQGMTNLLVSAYQGSFLE